MSKIAKRFTKAIIENNYDLVEDLLREYSDQIALNKPNQQGDNYLCLAVTNSSARIVNLLLKKTANPSIRNERNESAFSLIIKSGDFSDCKKKLNLILDYGIKSNLLKYALHDAVTYSNQSDIIKVLIDRGLDINLQDALGNTPLILASLYSSNEQFIIYLIKAGANLNIVNQLGINFSLGVISYERRQVIKLLKRKKYRCDLDNLSNQPLVLDKQAPESFQEKFLASTEEPNLAEIITFFSLPAKEQIALLLTLDREDKFSCCGDFSLLNLIIEYESRINALPLTILEELKTKHIMLHYALDNIREWIDYYDTSRDALAYGEHLSCKECLLHPEWILVRKFSQYVKYYLNIDMKINSECLLKKLRQIL